MKELITIIVVIMIFIQSCNSQEHTKVLSEFKVLHTIQLEENDSSFISNISDISVFSNNNILINSAGNGNAYIYDSKTGKILLTNKLPLDLIDTLKYHFEKYKLFQGKIKNIYSVNNLLDLTSNNLNIKKSELFNKTSEFYIRNIQKSIIADDSTVYHLARIRFLYKEDILDSMMYSQEVSMIVKMINNRIINCFVPDLMIDRNTDPHFPLYSNFILDNKAENSYYINVFNENYFLSNSNSSSSKFYYSTALQSRDYKTMKFFAHLPEQLIQYKVFYNFSYPHYVNLNDNIYYGFQLIDTIYDMTSSNRYTLEINTSNDHFFKNYNTKDNFDASSTKRVGFVVKSFSKNSEDNLCVTSQVFENYLKDSARATNYLFQEYNSKDFSLTKSVLIPYQYKIDNDNLYVLNMIKANPHKADEFIIIYKNKENYFLDFCKW